MSFMFFSITSIYCKALSLSYSQTLSIAFQNVRKSYTSSPRARGVSLTSNAIDFNSNS